MTLHERITKYIANDVLSYEHSLQSRGKLDFTHVWNRIFNLIVIVSLLVIIFSKKGSRNIFKTENGNIMFVLLAAILLNAWDCGTFANAIDRLGCKMIWLLPLLALCFAFPSGNRIKVK
jgi:hypothetical protein